MAVTEEWIGTVKRRQTPREATENTVPDFPPDVYRSSVREQVQRDDLHQSVKRDQLLHNWARSTPSDEDLADMEAAAEARADAREHGTVPWDQIRDELGT